MLAEGISGPQVLRIKSQFAVKLQFYITITVFITIFFKLKLKIRSRANQCLGTFPNI